MKFLIILCSFIFLYSYQLTIISNTKNSNGIAIISVYNTPNSIPDKNLNNYYKQKIVKIINNKIKTSFNLPQGIYAINIIHDENSNHTIDMGFMLPKEGIGFSNFNTINLFNKPNFKQASFKLDKNKTIKIKIIYF